MNATVSASFQQQATRAVSSIVLFVLVYLFLFIAVLGLSVLCVYGGVMLILAKPSFITLMLGGGMVGLAFFVFYFIIKFLFSRNKVDRSALLEVSATEEPALFEFIRETAAETGTPLPKKVYLSSDVNACVFYDSGFWSMLLPIKKNLQIGVGLVNSVTVSELKAIIAHEFGHFSQRSMKVGSYVYHVNHVMYNMLNDNESYNNMIGRFANMSGYFSFFAGIAVKIANGIQWVLHKMYGFVNLRYMALSREMEFHADEVAAYAAGSKPLVTSLLRLDLSAQALDETLDFYSRRIPENITSGNVYPHHRFVMQRLAHTSGVQLQHGLPDVTMDFLSRFNKSKLVVKNQWASHPETEERIGKLEILAVEKEQNNAGAWSLFKSPAATQEKMNAVLFSAVSYTEEPAQLSEKEFSSAYIADAERFRYHPVFNSYYDNRTLKAEDLEQVLKEAPADMPDEAATIFSAEVAEEISVLNALESDIRSLETIAAGNTGIKTFDYNGIRYTEKEAAVVLEDAKKQQEMLEAKLRQHDLLALKFFYANARRSGNETQWKERYNRFFEVEAAFKAAVEEHNAYLATTEFMRETQSYEFIEANMEVLKQKEAPLKEKMRRIFESEEHRALMTAYEKAALEKYLSCEWTYFIRPDYYNDALGVMYEALQSYYNTVFNFYRMKRKELFDAQAAGILTPAEPNFT